MCLARSVGQGGRNDLTDVMVFQILFNLNLPRFPDPKPERLGTDGRIGPKTIEAIRASEPEVMR